MWGHRMRKSATFRLLQYVEDQHLTVKQFRAALLELGWTQAELARRLRLRPGTVTRWVTSNTVPGFAQAYLELALQVVVLAKGLKS